jgi:hypothetical protein
MIRAGRLLTLSVRARAAAANLPVIGILARFIAAARVKGKFDPVFTAIQVLGAARTQIAPRQKWVAYVTAKDGRLYIDAAC